MKKVITIQNSSLPKPQRVTVVLPSPLVFPDLQHPVYLTNKISFYAQVLRSHPVCVRRNNVKLKTPAKIYLRNVCMHTTF